MPQKLETVLKHVGEIDNDVNRQLIKDYHKYLISRDTSTNYQKDNIKLIHMFAKLIDEFLNLINPELTLRGSSPTLGAIFAGLYIIFLLLRANLT